MWDKRHDVPEGFYEVRLVDVKCHNKETYKLQVEILKKGTKPWPEPTVITGYCRRYGTDFGDLEDCFGGGIQKRSLEMSRNVQSGNTQNLKSMVIQRSFPKWSVAERRKTAAASDQAAVCACAHSRYFAGGSPSGLRV